MPDQQPSEALAVAPDRQIGTSVQQPGPNLGLMLQAAIDKGITTENVAVLEKMLDLLERQQSRDAEREFAQAFNRLQAEMPKIVAATSVPDRDGNLKYKFAKYEDIMVAVRPLLLRHGFTVSFSMTCPDGRVAQECTLRHVGGHAQRNSFAVRIGKGPPGASEPQSDGAASTYAKRFALCNALNIIIEQDSDGAPPDARLEGEPIPSEKVQYLREQVQEIGADASRFLKLAGVARFEDITEGTYPVLIRFLESKKRGGSPQ